MGRQVIDVRKDGEKVYVKNHAKVTFLSDGTNVEQRIIDVSNDLSTKVNKDYIDDILENIIIDSSQIDFNQLKNNPFVDNNSGKLEVTDESGNIIAKIDVDGIHSVDFITGEHRLSDKTDKTYVDEAVKNVKVDLTGYATEEYVNNIDFYNIKDNPIVNNGDGKLLFVDENGYIGLQLEEDGLYVKDVIADGHTLSQKADKSDIPSLDGFVKSEDLPNFDEFAKTEDIPSLEGYAKSDDIPSLDGYAKTEDIPSLDGYAKTSDIPSLDGYATEEWVNNKNYATEYDLKTIDYSSINNVPVSEDETGELNITDESGNIGMKVSSEAVYAKDFIADGHTLSQKADKSDLSAYVKESEIQDTVTKADTAYNWGNHANAGYLKTETPETYYLELPIDEETGQCLMSGSLTQEQFEGISNCSVLIVRTVHVDSEEVLVSKDITFNWKISETEQYEGGSKAYAYSNLCPSLVEGCFVLYAITFNQYEGVCSYDLAKKRFVVDTEITDPTDAIISTNSVYELDLSSGTTDENGRIIGRITEEEFNQIAISKNIIVTTGWFNVSLTQRHTYLDTTINRLVFYGNIYSNGVSQRFVLKISTNGNERMYMAQLVPIVYELDLSSGTTDENGRITGNITNEEFNQIIVAESLAIKLGDHKVTFNQKSTTDRQGEYLFYGIYNDYEKEKIVLLIVLDNENEYIYEIRTQELGGSSAYPEVYHGTSNTTTSYALTPNTFHVWDEVQVLRFVLDGEIANVANEYLFQFTSGTEPTMLSLPDSIKFNSDFTVEANKVYQISILNGLGTVMSWDI